MEKFQLTFRRIDIDKPQFDMNTYVGRAKHFFKLTNPLNILASNTRLERAKEVITAYRNGMYVPYVNTMEDVWHEKYLYDSAFHPDTGEKIFILGRMSAQMPSNTFLTGCMVTLYKNPIHVLLLQWINQSFNALVNYSNRSGKSKISSSDLARAYFMATFSALFTAVALKRLAKNMSSMYQRLIPFASVAAANGFNLPMMRQNEIKNGIAVFDENDIQVGISRRAAIIGIYQVVLSRIAIAIPPMTFPPWIAYRLEKKGFFVKYPKWNIPVQVGLVGFTLIFATPLGCAFFKQKTSLNVDYLEKNVRDDIKQRFPDVNEVFYNKGL